MKDMPKQFTVEKVKKSLKTTGDSVYAVAWLTLIGNVCLYVWGILDKNYSGYHIIRNDLTGTVLVVILMFVWIVLGDRIRKQVDKNIKLYIQILLVSSILFLLLILYSGGIIGILFFIIVVYLIVSLRQINKAMKVEEFTSTLITPVYKLDNKGWKTFAGIAILLFFVAYQIDLRGPGFSNENYINMAVTQAKAKMTFPSRVDNVTTIIDIKAEPNSMHYFYLLNNVNTATLSNNIFKEKLTPLICKNNDSRIFLDKGITLEFSYTVEKSSENYTFLVAKEDCK